MQQLSSVSSYILVHLCRGFPVLGTGQPAARACKAELSCLSSHLNSELYNLSQL